MPIPRKKPLRRPAAPKQSKAPRTPIPKKNPARAKLAFARAFGGADRVQWVQGQPCATCGRTPSENAHIKAGGTGRRADAEWIVPLCGKCHATLHHDGQVTFEAVHTIDLAWTAQVIQARWEQYVAQHSPSEGATDASPCP